MRLRTKFIISVGLVLLVSFGITFTWLLQVQYTLVVSQTERQARMLANQIVLTRKWVADHNGLFLVKGPGVEANPFLDEGEVTDRQGITYVKRNPAMVTRELAEYAVHSDFWTFRVTSLKPVNPLNAPDEFEQESLKRFDQGDTEVMKIVADDHGRTLRYMVPLVVEESCMECHARHGYQVGNIRGALSLSIPMSWSDRIIAENARMLILFAGITVVIVGAVIFLLINHIVVRRLDQMEKVMEDFPQSMEALDKLPCGSDEIGTLSSKFFDLAMRLQNSQKELVKAKELIFQAEKMAALGRLSAGIAHEVNNPLGGMQNCVKIMQKNAQPDAAQQKYLGLLEKGLKRLEKIMRQLLNFGRGESLQRQKVSIHHLLDECLSLLEYRLKNIELRRDVQTAETYMLDGDALRQVLVNILLNALEAMPDGGRLSIVAKENNSTITLSIQDTGEGISQENIRHIFDPFFTTREIGKGTGLGLAVSYSLVSRMGGTIEVASEPEKGATFTISLPTASDHASSKNTQSDEGD